MFDQISLTLRTSQDLADGFVRLDQKDMHLLGVTQGSCLSIKAQGRTTYAKVLPALMEDRNQDIVRAPKLLAQNINAQEDEKVFLCAVNKKPDYAEQITLTVLDDIDSAYLKARLTRLASVWRERLISVGDIISIPTLGSHPFRAIVSATTPEGPVIITGGTTFSVNETQPLNHDIRLAGLRDAYRTCYNLGNDCIHSEDRPYAKAILLTGPAGTGKAHMAKRLAMELNIGLRYIDTHELLDKQQANGTIEIEGIFSELARLAPIVVLIDNIEALNNHPSSHAVVTQMCLMLDDLKVHRDILLVGVCSDTPEKRLLSGKRFDLVLPIDPPDRLARQEILIAETASLPINSKVDLQRLASMTHGYAAADLQRLVATTAQTYRSNTVGQEDFIAAIRMVPPTINDYPQSDIPEVVWNDVGGLDEVKVLLHETVSWSLDHFEAFAEAGVSPPRSILISGAQGTGKTSLVRALSSIMPIHFIELACPTLVTSNQQSAAKNLRDSFDLARRRTPCIVFFDDIDTLFDETPQTSEDQIIQHPIIAQLLTEMDRLHKTNGVIVIAATNRPDRLTHEMMRPGRFDCAMTLPLPDTTARKKILQIHSKKLPLASDVDFDRLAAVTISMTPADIANLCNRVGLLALRLSFNTDGGVLPPAVNAALFEQVLRGHKI